MNTSRLVTGLILIIVGFGIIVASFFSSFFILIYGIPILIVGFWIWFNEKEDVIEERQDVQPSSNAVTLRKERQDLNKSKTKKK